MNGETKSKILLILVVGLVALACGTIVSAFVHIDLPQESLLDDLEELENDTVLSINDSNVTQNYTKTTTKKSSSNNYKKSSSSSNNSDSSSTSSSGGSGGSSSHTSNGGSQSGGSGSNQQST